MVKCRNFLICMCFLFQANVVLGQNLFLENPEKAHDMALSLSELFMEKKFHLLFEEISNYWPTNLAEIKLLEKQTISSMNQLELVLGNPIESLLIDSEKIGDFAIRDTYLLRYSNIALRLRFVFYKNENGWIINSFKWDDSFEFEFKRE